MYSVRVRKVECEVTGDTQTEREVKVTESFPVDAMEVLFRGTKRERQNVHSGRPWKINRRNTGRNGVRDGWVQMFVVATKTEWMCEFRIDGMFPKCNVYFILGFSKGMRCFGIQEWRGPWELD